MSKDKNPPEASIRDRNPIPDKFKGGRLLNAIRYNTNISGIGKAILHDIASYCDIGENATFQEWIYRSKENLVKCTGFNEKAINKHIKILINDGHLLERSHKNKYGRNGPKEFRLTSKIFDEYLITLGDTNSHPLTDRGGDNCQGITDRGGDNCQGLGGDNCQGLGGDNCHPNHNEFQHNEDEHNEKKIEKENSTNFESGVNPRTPDFSGKDDHYLNEDRKAKRKIKEINKLGPLIIEDVNSQGFPYRSEIKKQEIMKTIISKIGVDNALENIKYLYEHKQCFIGKKTSLIINEVCNINYEEIKKRQEHDNEALEIQNKHMTEI